MDLLGDTVRVACAGDVDAVVAVFADATGDGEVAGPELLPLPLPLLSEATGAGEGDSGSGAGLALTPTLGAGDGDGE